MDYSLVKKSYQVETSSQTKIKKGISANPSPPEELTFRNTPSPNRPKPNQPISSFRKGAPEQPNSTEQYTPLGISRSQLLIARTPEDMDQLIIEHRYEVETLLLEIGRLHEQLNQAHELRELEMRKVKEELEETSHLQISQIRQNQHGQAQVFQLQIRKLKQQLSDRSQEVDKLQTLFQREKHNNERQKKQFTEEVRILIQKKNAEIFELRQESDNKLRDFEFQRVNEVEEIRYQCDKERSSLSKQLQKQQNQFSRLKIFSENQNKQKQKLILYLQNQRDSVERRYEQRLAQQTKKYENIRNKFNELINEFSEDSQTSRSELQKIFQGEYQHLMGLLNLLQKDNNQLRKQLQLSILGQKAQKQNATEENKHLKRRIQQVSENSLADMELLKVKLATLHENDLKNLKNLYELKLKQASSNILRLDDESSKLREFVNLLSAEKYEQKKKYDTAILNLNSRIKQMRSGMTSLESQYKNKLENEKSLLLMTSRSFIKEAQNKNNNNKFLEEELRKLRQLMELQGRENQNAQKTVDQRIAAANNELQRLSSKLLAMAKEKKDLENDYQALRAEKDEEIRKLRYQLTHPDAGQNGVNPQFKIIEDLKQELNKKKEEIGYLTDKFNALESRMKEMSAQTERLQMENNINTQELKKEFRGVAQQHLTDFKKYYEDKMNRLEEEKTQLKKIISSQYEQITELIKKYRQTQEDLKDAVAMMKKRTVLEDKVMNIGLNCNLVKNMAQLLPNSNNL